MNNPYAGMTPAEIEVKKSLELFALRTAESAVDEHFSLLQSGYFSSTKAMLISLTLFYHEKYEELLAMNSPKHLQG